MGIFSKTEEEIRLKEKNTRLKNLIDIINEAESQNKISTPAKDYLVEYVEGIRKGNSNDFDDIDTLYEVIGKVLNTEFYSEFDMRHQLSEVIKLYKLLVNKTSDENDSIKSSFLENFVGPNGLINNNLYDDSMYSLFTNKSDYFEIMNIIRNSTRATEHFDVIKEYVKSVCKYCLTQDILKRDIISFISGLDNVIDRDYRKYSDEETDNAKRRVGVYNLSPKELAECDSKLRKMGDYLEQFNIFLTSLGDEKEAITTMVDNGKTVLQRGK